MYVLNDKVKWIYNMCNTTTWSVGFNNELIIRSNLIFLFKPVWNKIVRGGTYSY